MENKRKESKYPKMPLDQRAKQFMPFKAVTGLEEALRRKEEEVESYKEVELVELEEI